MKNAFKKSQVQASDILQDDRIKIGGNMYRVVRTSFGYATNSRRIVAARLENDLLFEEITIYAQGFTLFTIYNQK